MKIQRDMECRASSLTLKFGTTSTAELSAVSAGRTLLPGKFLGRGHLKCDDTSAETTFRLSAKRTSPFNSAEASVQSTTGSRSVRISGSNAGYTMLRGSVKLLATHSIRQFLHHFPSGASPRAITFQLDCIHFC